MTTNNCSATEQQARQDRLEAAYAADGRHDPGHPGHGTYTGLLEQPLPEVESIALQKLMAVETDG
jgi:hypothetical protein